MMKQDFFRWTAELLLPKDDPDEMNGSIIRFFENLSVIGREESKISENEKKEFLSKTSSLVNGASRSLHTYLFDTEGILLNEFHGNEWIRVCKRRSNIEFLRSLYHDYFDPDWSLFLDCENLDYMLKQKGDFEGGLSDNEIPEGTPPAHWWWWHPLK